MARGFEERLADKRVDSPTCSRQGIRLAFITASSKKWELQAMDISAAFLQGNVLKRTVYVRPPKDYKKEGIGGGIIDMRYISLGFGIK